MKILFHKLFGWHYIAFTWGNGEIIRRVKFWPSGVKTICVYDRIAHLDEETKTLSDGRKYIELT